jgi:transcriptional regulator with XRE-family HTH domain
MLGLVERLSAIQVAHKWSDQDFARQLGITRVMWQQVQHSDRRFGQRTLRTIVRAFPELGSEVLGYLSDAPDEVEDAAEPLSA